MQRILAVSIASIVCFLALTWVFLGFRDESEKSEAQVQAIVTILPQQQIVERIGGDRVAVTSLIPPGANHESYEPTITEMQKVANADIWFQIGTLSVDTNQRENIQAVNPEMKIVNTSVTNTFRHLEEHAHEGEEHEDELEEESAERDPHVWLSPKMVKEQATVIAEALTELDPPYADIYQQNLELLHAELDQLDADLRIAFQPLQGKTVLVYHPAFGYLADEYGFTQEFIEIEGKEPTLQQMQAILSLAKAEGITTIFVQKQFSQESAQAIAQELTGRVVTVDPVAPDYFASLRALAHSFVQ